MDCSVCLTSTNEPKILPCHHWLCIKCVEDLIRTSASRDIKCPQCRSKTRIPLEGASKFPTDFRQLQIRDYLKTQDKAALCSMNDGNDAVMLCHECSVHLCTDCVGLHKTNKFSSSHTLHEIVLSKCDKHDRLQEYICERCPQLMCILCTQTMCMEHVDDVHYLDLDLTTFRK